MEKEKKKPSTFKKYALRAGGVAAGIAISVNPGHTNEENTTSPPEFSHDILLIEQQAAELLVEGVVTMVSEQTKRLLTGAPESDLPTLDEIKRKYEPLPTQVPIELLEPALIFAEAPDRQNCEEMRGTPYRSIEERDFFLGNCVENPPASEVNRANCSEIRGEQYYSPSERRWFLANCVTNEPAQTQAAPQTQAQPRASSQGSSQGGFIATHYGESFNGGTLGCGTGIYSSNNPEIVAVSPSRYNEWPCGTRFKITNPENGAVLYATRHDACPGCGHNHLDLSEAGLSDLCGGTNCGKLSGLIVEVQ